MSAAVGRAVGHEALLWRHHLEGRLVAETGVHVGHGSGDGDPGASDAPVIKDASGRPFLPGSSLRGALRSGIESLLRGLQVARVCDPNDPTSACGRRIDERKKRERDPEPGQSARTPDEAFQADWEDSCEVCRLFGNTHLAGRVRVADLPLADPVEPADALTRRDGVGIDRDLRTASRGILYDFEAAEAGLVYRLRLECENLGDAELGLLLVGLELVGDGSAAVGGKSSRGLGRFRLEGLTVSRRGAADYFEGRAATPLGREQLDAARQAAVARYARREA